MLRDFWVNGAAAWGLTPIALRHYLYRRHGIALHRTASIYAGAFFGSPRVEIGARTFINHQCFFDSLGAIQIGADCALGPRVMICTSTHLRGVPARRAGQLTAQRVTIGDGCWIGAGAVILPGVSIGAGCIIAAGAVVTRDCDPHGLYGGIPARRLEDLP